MKRLSLSTAVVLTAAAFTFTARPAASNGLFVTKPNGNAVAPAPAPAPAVVTQPPVPTGAVTAPPSTSNGGVVTAPPVSPGAVIAPPAAPGGTPNTPPVDPGPAVGGVGVVTQPTTAPIRQVEYSPSELDLGELSSLNQERRTAVVTIKAPTTSAVIAGLGPVNTPFKVTRLTSYRYGIPTSAGPADAMAVPLQRQAVHSVAGNGTLMVQAGQEIDVEVELKAGVSMAPLQQATLWAQGYQWQIQVPVKAVVTLLGKLPEVVPVRREIDYRLLPGGHADVTIQLLHKGGPAQTVTLVPHALPAGITMETVNASVSGNREISLRFKASDTAPEGRDLETTVMLHVGNKRVPLTFNGHVYPHEITWAYEQMLDDDLQVKGELVVRSNGTWRWRADLKSYKGIIGDRYAVGFKLNLPYDKPFGGLFGFVGCVERGEIGGALGSAKDKLTLIRSSENEFANPVPEWIQKNYLDIVDSGASFFSTRWTNHDEYARWLTKVFGGFIIDIAKGIVKG